MSHTLPRLDPDIAAQAPWADGTLFADARHSLDPDEPFDPNAKAMAIIRTLGNRPASALKVGARAFQLHLTMADKGVVDTTGLAGYALTRALGLARMMSDAGRGLNLMLAEAQGRCIDAKLAALHDRKPRQMFNWRNEPGYAEQQAVFAQVLANDPEFERLAEWPHPFDEDVAMAGGIEQVALKVVAHVRARGAVWDSDAVAVALSASWCRRRGLVAPEPLLTAMSYVTGVVSPTGAVQEWALRVLWRTQWPNIKRRSFAAAIHR